MAVLLATEIANRIAEVLEEPGAAPSLATGSAGFALLFHALECIDGQSRWTSLRRSAMQHAATAHHENIGLHTGVSGVLAAAEIIGRRSGSYTTLRKQLRSMVLWGVDAYYGHAPVRKSPESTGEYDLISGLAGVALALELARSGELGGVPEYLGWLLEDVSRLVCVTDGVLEALGPTLNLGVAHGLAGVLSALSTVEPSRSTYKLLNTWAEELKNYGVLTETGYAWPVAVAGDKRFEGRSAWCYGALGVAAALLRISDKVSSATVADFALDVIGSTIAPQTKPAFEDCGICHGMIGHALILSRAGQSSGIPELCAAARSIAFDVAESYDSSLRFGYLFTGRSASEFEERPGLLVGAAGVALGVLAVCCGSPFEWTSILAIS